MFWVSFGKMLRFPTKMDVPIFWHQSMKNASFSVDDVVYSFFSLDHIQHFCPQLCLFALQPHTQKKIKSRFYFEVGLPQKHKIWHKKNFWCLKNFISSGILDRQALAKKAFSHWKCIFNIISHTEWQKWPLCRKIKQF